MREDDVLVVTVVLHVLQEVKPMSLWENSQGDCSKEAEAGPAALMWFIGRPFSSDNQTQLKLCRPAAAF